MATKKVKVDTPETEVVEEVKVEEKPKKYGVVANCTALNVRKDIRIESEILGVVYPGDKCEITKEYIKTGWYGVTFANGLKGFCVSNYINVVK